MTQPLLLIILDGWGESAQTENNGIALASKPNFSSWIQNYPHTFIEASGPAVGLPEGIMGNSEVGHMNMGAGRIVYTGLSQIYQAISDQSFFTNSVLLTALAAAKVPGRKLHLIGLVSDGAVHSHQDHLKALLQLAKQQGVSEVYVHAFTDGRDTAPRDAARCVGWLEEEMKQLGIGKVASVSGRFYAMDRDHRWERVEAAYDAMVGVAPRATSALDVIQSSYAANVGDEFIVPHTIVDGLGNPIGAIENGDSVICFNFRADRAREITRALSDHAFLNFVPKKDPQLSSYVCMAPYDENFALPIAFPQKFPTETFGEVISKNGLRQLRIAETEKYAHVTFFFSGGREKPFEQEERVLVPSPRTVATYDLKPEMAAPEIASTVVEKINEDAFDVYIVNFANPDMVGHTANQIAIPQAIEVVDECLGQVVAAALAKNGTVVITSDHGNAECMQDDEGRPHTAHTTNLVPFLIISEKFKSVRLTPQGGRLCDIAPSLLQVLDIPQPKLMTGVSLIL